jgi:hypothetical protein
MTYLRKIGAALAVVAAAMAMTAAAASAEQSTFCKVDETPCKSSNHYSTGTEYVMKSKGAIKWVYTAATFLCEGAEFEGKTANTGSSTEAVEMVNHTQFLWSCSAPFDTLSGARMKVDWTKGTMNGTVKVTGLEYAFTNGTNCRYGGEIKEGVTMTGGSPALMTFKEAPVPKISGGFLCASAAKLSVEFEVTTPKPIYVSNS